MLTCSTMTGEKESAASAQISRPRFARCMTTSGLAREALRCEGRSGTHPGGEESTLGAGHTRSRWTRNIMTASGWVAKASSKDLAVPDLATRRGSSVRGRDESDTRA